MTRYTEKPLDLDEIKALYTETPNAIDFHGSDDMAEAAIAVPSLVREVQRLQAELARWESGQRRLGLPVVESVPDGLHYAARLVRAIGTEGGEAHDDLLHGAAQRLKALSDAASYLLAERRRDRLIVQAAYAWRQWKNYTYRPGEINPQLLSAHSEDLELASAIDRSIDRTYSGGGS